MDGIISDDVVLWLPKFKNPFLLNSNGVDSVTNASTICNRLESSVMMSRKLILLALGAALAVSCSSPKPPHAIAKKAEPSKEVQVQTPSKFAPMEGWVTDVSGPGILPGQSASGYDLGIDQAEFHRGKASATIVSTGSNPDSWRAFSQGIRANNYRGNRIRLTGYLKTKDVSGGAGLWMRVDGMETTLTFDNMATRAIHDTQDWTKCSVVLDVPDDAVTIYFGSILMGTGQCWADDFKLETVDRSDAKTTAIRQGPDYLDDPDEPQNLDFTSTPTTSKDLDIPGWRNGDGQWDSAIHLNVHAIRNGKPTAVLYNDSTGYHLRALFQEIKAAPYGNKRVQFQAFIRATTGVDGGVMVSVPGGGQWVFSSVAEYEKAHKSRVPTSMDWIPLTAVVDVPNWANCIQFGVELHDKGAMHISETSFEIVDPASTPLTDPTPVAKLYTVEFLNRLPLKPVNLDFEK